MAREIAGKPGSVDAVQLELCQQFCVIDDIEAATQIDETKKRNLALIHGRERAVRNTNEGCLGGVPGPETVLGWGEEMVGCEVVVQLLLDNLLHHLCHDRKDRDGTEVGRIVGIPGLADRMYQGVLPD